MADLDNLLSRRMSREQFLKTLGIAFLTVTGITAVLNTLGGGPSHHTPKVESISPGFGFGPYGGYAAKTKGSHSARL